MPFQPFVQIFKWLGDHSGLLLDSSWMDPAEQHGELTTLGSFFIDLKGFIANEEKEWGNFMRFKSVRVLSVKESEQIANTVDPRDILSTDFKYKDKNAGARTPENNLKVEATARLTTQGQRERMALQGLVKLDAPTVQRTSFYVWLQITVSLQ